MKHFIITLLLLVSIALSACSSTTDIIKPVISAVKVTYIGNSTAIITWTTDEDSTSQVEYGTTVAYGNTTTPDETYTKSHGVELTDLDPDTTFYYKVLSEDASGNESSSTDETSLTNEETSTMAKNGDTVEVHYTGTLDDGTEFDSSVGGDPLPFTVGDGKLLSGFELAVIGMQAGQSKTFTILAENAYGLLEYVVNRNQIPAGTELDVGQQVYYQAKANNYIVCTVTEISDTTVTLQNTHDLAGEDLTFEIELVEIL